MAQIRWTVGARQDLREMVAYIQRDSAVYAVEMAGRIVTAVEKLAELPNLGRIVPEYQDSSLREVIVGNYRVVYRLGAKTPWDCRGRPRQPRPLTPSPSRFLGSEYLNSESASLKLRIRIADRRRIGSLPSIVSTPLTGWNIRPITNPRIPPSALCRHAVL